MNNLKGGRFSLNQGSKLNNSSQQNGNLQAKAPEVKTPTLEELQKEKIKNVNGLIKILKNEINQDLQRDLEILKDLYDTYAGIISKFVNSGGSGGQVGPYKCLCDDALLKDFEYVNNRLDKLIEYFNSDKKDKSHRLRLEKGALLEKITWYYLLFKEKEIAKIQFYAMDLVIDHVLEKGKSEKGKLKIYECKATAKKVEKKDIVKQVIKQLREAWGSEDYEYLKDYEELYICHVFTDTFKQEQKSSKELKKQKNVKVVYEEIPLSAIRKDLGIEPKQQKRHYPSGKQK